MARSSVFANRPGAWGAGRTIVAVCCAVAIAVFAGCAELSGADDTAGGIPPSDDQGGGGSARDAGVGGEGDASPPPEPEETFLLSAPTASRNFVFVANSVRGSLAKIDAETLQVTTVRVGHRPTIVRTVPESDTAVVLNEGGSSVTIVRASLEPGEDEITDLDVVRGANRLALTPTGGHAFAWFDNSLADETDEVGSVSEVSLLHLERGVEASFTLSVGVNVRDVRFAGDASQAFIITDDGVSVVDVTTVEGDRFFPPVRVDEPGSATPLGRDREILVSADGSAAIVRTFGDPVIRIVPLDGAARVDLELSAQPTDIDPIPGTDDVILSLRERSEILRLDLTEAPNGLEAATVARWEITDASAGQSVVTSDGQRALVFSAVDESTILSVLDLESGEARAHDLRKRIRGATLAPGDRGAIVYHHKAPGEPVAGGDEEEILARSHAFSAVDLDRELTKLVLVDAEPGTLAFAREGRDALVMAADPEAGERSLIWTELTTFDVREIGFDRLPEHVGAIPGSDRVFISQRHELGRIAFLDLTTGEVRVVTGYELNSFIE